MEIYWQIPEPNDSNQQIAGSTTENRELSGKVGVTKIGLLSIDLPSGVYCTITKDGVKWFYSKGNEKGTLKFKCGVLYEELQISIQNTNATAQDYHVRFILWV